MTSTGINPSRLGFAAGVAVLATLAIGAPAFAVDEFPPNAVVTATSGCEGDTFWLRTIMSNPGGLSSAHFVVTAIDVKGPITIDVGVDIAPNESRLDIWNFFEGVKGTVHITSDGQVPVIDYVFEIAPDCVPEVVVTEETTTTVAEVLVPTELPTTGSSSPVTAAFAVGLLGVGILMLRVTRRTN